MASPILPSQLLKMCAYMSDSLGHVAIKAALIMGFRGLLRKSQLTASKSSSLRGDIKFYSWGMVITVRKSETIQFKDREFLIPISRYVRDMWLCAVYWMSRHFEEVPLPDSEAALKVPSPRGGGGLSHCLTHPLFCSEVLFDLCRILSYSVLLPLA